MSITHTTVAVGTDDADTKDVNKAQWNADHTFTVTKAELNTAVSDGNVVYVGDAIANRVVTTTSTATLTPNADTTDISEITAQAAALTIANPTGTPVNGQGLLIKITDNGTARALSYGAQFRAIGSALATTTTINKTMYIGCIWDSTDSKWDTYPAQVEV